jgi:ABC-type glycerol-3-phosphate transport system substrate-binding protein
MSMSGFSRRTFLQGSVGLTVANFVPGTTPFASAATMEEQTITAAKAAGKADVNGMIWSPYLVPMKPVIAEFTKETGIGIGAVQDISIFDAPQRAMAEALSHSPQFDFIHIDSNMIPSLASAGYLEPLDDYIKKAGFHLDAVADYGNFMKYGGQTYGVPTDGNVHIQYTRKDLIDDPDNKKRFADKFGTELKIPVTWEDTLRVQEFLMDPSKDLYGSGNLRNRANGVTWWYMIFYSAGGFPFDDDMKPTIDTPAGQYAVDIYLQDKKVNHPEAANLGTPQMIPRIAQGHVVACQYWDGTCKTIANPKQSKTVGQFYYSVVPGSKARQQADVRRSALVARRDHWSASTPAQGAGGLPRAVARLRKNTSRSCPIRSTRSTTPWATAHFAAPPVIDAYTQETSTRSEKNFRAWSAADLPHEGYLEFQGRARQEPVEAVGQLPPRTLAKTAGRVDQDHRPHRPHQAGLSRATRRRC